MSSASLSFKPPSEPNSARARFITKPPIKRILRKANITRISHDVDQAIYNLIVEYTAKILEATVVFTDHAPRKTIQILDLEAGLRQNHQCLAVKLKKTLRRSTDEASPGHNKRSVFPGQEIPFNNFKELCKSIVKEKGHEYRFAAWVFALLQYAVETYTYDIALLARKCALHSNNRKTLRASDLYLARELRGW